MKICCSLLVLGFAASTFGFSPQQQSRSNIHVATALNVEQSRQAFLVQGLTVLGSATILGLQTSPAFAASYFPGVGVPPTAVLNPKSAEIDDQIMASKSVQTAIAKIKDYKSAVTKMQSVLENDSQANIRSIIVKELDLSNIRESLNTFNTAFEEDTQRGTDRLIRVILQDITELEIANRQKEDITRSSRRIETMKGKLTKLDKAFTDILAFAN